MICISGYSSHLQCTLFPPYDLGSNSEWEMGFIDLMTYNSIPNIEENVNNKLYIENHEISLPTGAFEIDDINNYINRELQTKDSSIKFTLSANLNTLKSEIYCSKEIDFTKENTIGSLLGFNKSEKLLPNILHSSPSQVRINKVDIIRITCNLVHGSYRDGAEGHVLHEFYPSVGPGYKIIEKPSIVKYLPINRQSMISEIHIRLEDQEGKLVNFRDESINIRLDIRKRKQ